MASIPAFVVEYFLLGRTRPGALEHFIQDAGVVTDVWLAFAKEPDKPQRVLVAPARDTSTILVGDALHRAITAYRKAFPKPLRPRTPNVSPLENFVALTIYFDELVQILLPLTAWWHRKHLSKLNGNPALQEALSQSILYSLGAAYREGMHTQRSAKEIDNRVLEAGPLAALLGVFVLLENEPNALDAIGRDKLMEWIASHASAIANGWTTELQRGAASWPIVTKAIPDDMQREKRGDQPELIERVFLDREAEYASEANCAIKADAAKRVFDVSCRGITWAVIDSGIATTHPAFVDHYKRKNNPAKTSQRIKATLDFTAIQMIRNFDLVDEETRADEIARVIAQLELLPGRDPNAPEPGFKGLATNNLQLIAEQLKQRLPPDWALIEPLIRIEKESDGSDLPSDHGTHVAGIIGADWRDDAKGTVLQGVAPDIDLYDLRVVHRSDIASTEFALLAALEYVQFVNARAGSRGPIIHGVNISMSIPHKVRTYGCGATPVCVACDRLVGAGVIVVAAAGNRGWNEMELGFGNFVSSSITDPGNAREVITVGSTHSVKPHVYGVSYFSSRGPTGDGRIKPDIVAPGERIRSAIRGNADGELDGTSMAAPFVSGAAAMLISRHRELIGDPRRVKQILLDSATDLGREKYFQGHGLVDVLRAMQSI
ncbi:MAG TPA: S8 family peptidase [Thermoanaerobaculia bacterium]